jgi:CRP-like cAMP-binding protein
VEKERRDPQEFAQTWLQGNHLLKQLNQESLQCLVPLLTPVDLAAQQVVYKPEERISNIYFPDNSVLCMLTVMEDGRSIEAATVGHEGASWVSASLGSPTMPCQTMVAIGGRAHKIAARHVKEEVRRNGAFHNVLTEYSHALLISSLRTGSCNGLHSVTQRACRWMLLTLDRIGDKHFSITQEFLSALLGCTRSTVNLTLADLEKANAIRTSRGAIEVVNRAALEQGTCECYEIIRAAYEALKHRELYV